MPDRDGVDSLYDERDGLYGKLDRLRGRRGPDALVVEPKADDFPLLTEVVELPVAWPPTQKVSIATPAAHEPTVPTVQEITGVMAAVESRLNGLIARQQQQLVEAVCQIVREELSKRGLH